MRTANVVVQTAYNSFASRNMYSVMSNLRWVLHLKTATNQEAVGRSWPQCLQWVASLSWRVKVQPGQRRGGA